MTRSLLIAVFVAALAGTGCDRRERAPRSGGASGRKADAARKQAETLALGGVTEAAKRAKHLRTAARGTPGVFGDLIATATASAAARATTTPVAAQTTPAPAPPAKPQPKPTPTRYGTPPLVRELVWNQLPGATEAEAEADAIAVAQDVIEKRLAELDPPVTYRPTANEVKNEFIRRDSRTPPNTKLGEIRGDENDPRAQRAAALRALYAKEFGHSPEEAARLYYVEFQVEVTVDQVRELRTRDRLADALRILGLVSAAAVAGYSFLRLDQWTRGHLTRWLAIAAAALAGGAAGVLYLL
jgi:hypothetical protein